MLRAVRGSSTKHRLTSGYYQTHTNHITAAERGHASSADYLLDLDDQNEQPRYFRLAFTKHDQTQA